MVPLVPLKQLVRFSLSCSFTPSGGRLRLAAWRILVGAWCDRWGTAVIIVGQTYYDRRGFSTEEVLYHTMVPNNDCYSIVFATILIGRGIARRVRRVHVFLGSRLWVVHMICTVQLL